jgi:hypothetical protein
VPTNIVVNIPKNTPPGCALEPRAGGLNGKSPLPASGPTSWAAEQVRQAVEAKEAEKRRQQRDPAPPAALPASTSASAAPPPVSEGDRRQLDVLCFALEALGEKEISIVVQALDEVLDELEANSENLAFIEFVAETAKAIAGTTSWPRASALAVKAGHLRLSCAS